jgi:hypothetical protein
MTTTADFIRERNDANSRNVALESELFALGVQVAALKERLKLAETAVEKLREFRAAITWNRDPEWGVNGLRVINSIDLSAVSYSAGIALAAFDAVPGDVGATAVEPPDTRPRYASGEVPMVGDVFRAAAKTEVVACTINNDGYPVDANDEYWSLFGCTLVRRAATDALARAVALLREHAYDQRVIDFLADFDKGGV